MVVIVALRLRKIARWWPHFAHWLGFGPPELNHDLPAAKPSTVVLFRWLNWPWTTFASVGAVLEFGSHFPPLTEGYVIAGLAGSATVARVAPTLAQLTVRSLRPGTSELPWSVPQSAVASRRALGWALLSLIVLPWIPPKHVRIDWLMLVVPASFAGRALWESWWRRVAWRVARRLT